MGRYLFVRFKCILFLDGKHFSAKYKNISPLCGINVGEGGASTGILAILSYVSSRRFSLCQIYLRYFAFQSVRTCSLGLGPASSCEGR